MKLIASLKHIFKFILHLKDYENVFLLNLTVDCSKFHFFSKLHVLSK